MTDKVSRQLSGQSDQMGNQPKSGKKLIRFNQCKCARKEFCRMFGQDPSCDEVIPDYPKEEQTHADSGTRFIEENFR
jgi:hypothetical protein